VVKKGEGLKAAMGEEKRKCDGCIEGAIDGEGEQMP
jgi:hypothetical protein